MYQQLLPEKPRWGVQAVTVKRSTHFMGKPPLPQDLADLIDILI